MNNFAMHNILLKCFLVGGTPGKAQGLLMAMSSESFLAGGINVMPGNLTQVLTIMQLIML